MSRNTIANKPTTPPNRSSTLLTGILVGMIIGVTMAAGLAWYIMKSPSPFTQKEQGASKQPVAAEKPAETVTSTARPTPVASGVSDGKPRFEFYKVLTDKPDKLAAPPVKPPEKIQPIKPQPVENKPVSTESYFLQAGSFSNMEDAEKFKAKLAMAGIEANIQTVTIPDKGIWHRVRSGPYSNMDEMNTMRNLLKQNGVEATQTRAQ
jgi:cell division protein FtsN